MPTLQKSNLLQFELSNLGRASEYTGRQFASHEVQVRIFSEIVHFIGLGAVFPHRLLRVPKWDCPSTSTGRRVNLQPFWRHIGSGRLRAVEQGWRGRPSRAAAAVSPSCRAQLPIRPACPARGARLVSDRAGQALWTRFLARAHPIWIISAKGTRTDPERFGWRQFFLKARASGTTRSRVSGASGIRSASAGATQTASAISAEAEGANEVRR